MLENHVNLIKFAIAPQNVAVKSLKSLDPNPVGRVLRSLVLENHAILIKFAIALQNVVVISLGSRLGSKKKILWNGRHVFGIVDTIYQRFIQSFLKLKIICKNYNFKVNHNVWVWVF